MALSYLDYKPNDKKLTDRFWITPDTSKTVKWCEDGLTDCGEQHVVQQEGDGHDEEDQSPRLPASLQPAVEVSGHPRRRLSGRSHLCNTHID